MYNFIIINDQNHFTTYKVIDMIEAPTVPI